MRRAASLLLALAMAASSTLAPALSTAARADAFPGGVTRIKDITTLKGMRENQLVGYGLVVGLANTGDTLRNAPFTEQSLTSMLDRMGVNVGADQLRARNVAAVVVTSELPPFIGRGSRIDVTVSALGDARSLLGGTLVITPLMGADGQIYAVAQGPVAVTGFSAAGEAEVVTQGVPTVGRVPNGALVERELPDHFGNMRSLILELRNPDFRTAVRIADAINVYTQARFGGRGAYERDYRSVLVVNPPDVSPVRFLAELGDLVVTPDTPARVVIDERTGTVVIGADVRISTVAVTHGNLTVRVTELPVASQPPPFSNGQTVVLPDTRVEVQEGEGRLAIIQGSSLQTLVAGLNQIGLRPAGIIAILQAIKSAGALQADLVIQ
ncbi:flagellar basal body P-ring protein FlgI [Salinarimonas sp. NSM]|uniref:flagellar basal body P-ring protein FlgI n=1 Tax=Salinarimonas sp. NSM TaxID=3458003 RepID=UPI00403567AA